MRYQKLDNCIVWEGRNFFQATLYAKCFKRFITNKTTKGKKLTFYDLRPNLKNFSSGLNLSRGTNMVGST